MSTDLPLPEAVPRPTPPRGGRKAVLAAVLGVLAVLAWAGSVWRRREEVRPGARQRVPPPPDPRLTYAGPYRNVRPDVKYVGDSACAGCHKPETDGYHRHPMGRSLVPIRQLAASQRYDKTVHNPFEALGNRFTVERQGDRVWHREERPGGKGELLAAFRPEVEYAIGSGRRGHSYFTSRNGFLSQTAVSWYSQKQIWDLSPGFQNGKLRPVIPLCVFCHANSARPVPHSRNRYEEPIFTQAAIGCERCHGPGEVHVQARRRGVPVKGKGDPTIVNPKRLPLELRESICQQCHLEGAAQILRRGRDVFDYRPGLALGDFWAIYLPAPALDRERPAVGHVEQMYQSKCFTASRSRKPPLGAQPAMSRTQRRPRTARARPITV